MANLNMQLYRFLMNMNQMSEDRQFSVNLNQGIMILLYTGLLNAYTWMLFH